MLFMVRLQVIGFRWGTVATALIYNKLNHLPCSVAKYTLSLALVPQRLLGPMLIGAGRPTDPVGQ